MNDENEVPKSNGWIPKKPETEQFLKAGAGKSDQLPDTKTCCICGGVYEGYGHNPKPVKETGRCCEDCNWTVVYPARVTRMEKGQKPYEGGLDEERVKAMAENMMKEMEEKKKNDDTTT